MPHGALAFPLADADDKLFYKTDYTCQSKPVFRALKHAHLYQFQSPTKRSWVVYDTVNSTYAVGTREWCDAWHAKPLLAMPLATFQHPLSKPKRAQRWQRVIVHAKNNSYTYKPISSKPSHLQHGCRKTRLEQPRRSVMRKAYMYLIR